jgi:hypothetical protein
MSMYVSGQVYDSSETIIKESYMMFIRSYPFPDDTRRREAAEAPPPHTWF